MSALAPLLVTTKSGKRVECDQVRLADRLDESGDRNVVLFTAAGLFTVSVGDLLVIRPNAPPPETNLQKLLAVAAPGGVQSLTVSQLEDVGGRLASLMTGQ